MVFNASRVHIYGPGKQGGEQLIGTAFYKRFQQKETDGQIVTYNIQGGKWYLGEDPVEISDVPDWVWNECRSMKPSYRRMYLIVLPEEAKKGAKARAITDREINEALLRLDPLNDSHWDNGYPNLEVLGEILGSYVPRSRVDVVNPNFVRPMISD